MASPLTLLMPVIPGTSPEVIAATLAKYQPVLDQALTSIGTVHYARTLLLDAANANLQPGTESGAKYVIAVITEYDGSFDAYIWRFVDGKPKQNRWRLLADLPAKTPASVALSKDLVKRGFRFVGPTICYAHMQATGMVNDHLVGCFRHAEVAALSPASSSSRSAGRQRRR